MTLLRLLLIYMLISLLACKVEQPLTGTARIDVSTDKAAPTLIIEDIIVTEGSGGLTTDAVFTVTSSIVAEANISFNYTVAGGSATLTSDLVPISGSAVILAGTNSITVTIPVVADNSDEDGENFSFTLSNGSGYYSIASDLTATATITDDDVPAGFTEIVLGEKHSCGLRGDKTTYCWGDDSGGQLGDAAANVDQSIPVLVNTANLAVGASFTQITAGANHSCGVTSDGQAYCWGKNTSGQLGDGSNIDQNQPAVVDITNLTPGSGFVRITAGGDHTCGLASDGIAYCWGKNLSGQLGDTSNVNRNVPVEVDRSNLPLGSQFLELSAGSNHTCGTDVNRTSYCWGQDSSGQLGDGGANLDFNFPQIIDMTNLTAGTTFIQLAAEKNRTCGIANNGKTFCWGEGTPNLIIPTLIDSSNMTAGSSFIQISGQCGMANNGVAYCWEADGVPEVVSLANLSPGTRFKQVTSTGSHSCGTASDGRLFCWGVDDQGQLGDGGSNQNKSNPSLVQTGNLSQENAIVQLTGGRSHTCALTSDGRSYCWGVDGFYGKLGDGGANDTQFSPNLLDMFDVQASSFVTLFTGERNGCGTTDLGQTYCWGSDNSGALGDGGAVDLDKYTPVNQISTSPLTAGASFISIAGGNLHMCGLSSDGKAYCWGDDTSGQLGDGGANVDKNIPTLVNTSALTPGSKFVKLFAGGANSFGIASDGKAYAWGSDTAGQLGDGGTNTAKNIPTLIDISALTSGSGLVQISIANTTACGLASDGKAFCWGADTSGQLGDGGTNTAKNIPTAVDTSAVAPGVGWLLVTTGFNGNSCGLTSDGNTYCWGADFNGLMGDGVATTVNRNVPLLINTVNLPIGAHFIHLDAGDNSCGIASNGLAYCWGPDDGVGNGNGITSTQHSPVAVDTTPFN